MYAGRLRTVARIDRYEEVTDANGSIIKNWSVLKSDLRCSIEPITGTENFIGDRISNEVTHKINIRYTDITPKDRIVYNSRVFDIVNVLNWKELNKDLTILAKETL
jgi:SPP1 family predicted phage head-tail adaptor